MGASLNSVSVNGYDTNNPGDPVASVTLSGLTFQAGEDTLWEFVTQVKNIVAAAQNVDTVLVTKYETVSTTVA